MVESRPLIIPDPSNSSMHYQATPHEGKINLIHKPINPQPGMIGSGGTMQTLTPDEFKKFLMEIVPKIKLERTPPKDTFTAQNA